MAVPWTTRCRSTRLLERDFVELSGKRLTSAGVWHYLMMIDNGYSQMGNPYILMPKSDAPAALVVFGRTSLPLVSRRS